VKLGAPELPPKNKNEKFRVAGKKGTPRFAKRKRGGVWKIKRRDSGCSRGVSAKIGDLSKTIERKGGCQGVRNERQGGGEEKRCGGKGKRNQSAVLWG